MTDESLTCDRPECDGTFVKKTHNQKYCSPECCRVETNRKIMEKYHAKQAIKKGLERRCSKCNNKLSRYNEDSICGGCQTSHRYERRDGLAEILSSISL